MYIFSGFIQLCALIFRPIFFEKTAFYAISSFIQSFPIIFRPNFFGKTDFKALQVSCSHFQSFSDQIFEKNWLFKPLPVSYSHVKSFSDQNFAKKPDFLSHFQFHTVMCNHFRTRNSVGFCHARGFYLKILHSKINNKIVLDAIILY